MCSVTCGISGSEHNWVLLPYNPIQGHQILVHEHAADANAANANVLCCLLII
jgi:hypothetical protein